MPIRITASGAERAIKCPASLALPHVYTESVHAKRGTELHAYCANALLHGRDKALAEAPDEYRAECAAVDVDAIQSALGTFDTLYVELAMQANLQTGKGEIVGENIGRAYPVTDDPYVVYGTADLVAFNAENGESTLTVLDIKTGMQVTSASRNMQLATLAVLGRAVSSAERKPTRYRVGIVYIDEDGAIALDSAMLDDMDLDAHQHELRTAISNALKISDKPSVTTGSHCRYCPAFNACPAKQSLSLDLARNAGIFKPGHGNLSLNPQQAGEVYAKAKEAREWLDAIMDAIKERAQTEPIPLPSGATLREVKGSESIDYNVAFAVLMEYGAEVAANASDAKITKASLKRALNGKHGEALQKIKAAGGIKQGSASVKEVK